MRYPDDAGEASAVPRTTKVEDAVVPVGRSPGASDRYEVEPSNEGTERLATVVSDGWFPPVACVALFVLALLSFQHPTVPDAVAPVHVDDVSSVDVSAPSSQSLSAAGVMTVDGYGIAVAVAAGPVPTFDVAVTDTV